MVHLLKKKVLNRWQVRILDTLANYPGLNIQHISGKDNIADGLSRIDHKIAQLAAMPKPALSEHAAVKSALLEAMQEWPEVDDGDHTTLRPPILPQPSGSRQ